jgi:hypothetical protein
MWFLLLSGMGFSQFIKFTVSLWDIFYLDVNKLLKHAITLERLEK